MLASMHSWRFTNNFLLWNISSTNESRDQTRWKRERCVDSNKTQTKDSAFWKVTLKLICSTTFPVLFVAGSNQRLQHCFTSKWRMKIIYSLETSTIQMAFYKKMYASCVLLRKCRYTRSRRLWQNALLLL